MPRKAHRDHVSAADVIKFIHKTIFVPEGRFVAKPLRLDPLAAGGDPEILRQPCWDQTRHSVDGAAAQKSFAAGHVVTASDRWTPLFVGLDEYNNQLAQNLSCDVLDLLPTLVRVPQAIAESWALGASPPSARSPSRFLLTNIRTIRF